MGANTNPADEFAAMPAQGVTLNVARAGSEHGPLVVLLHGFPEFWYGWRHQIGPLAREGFRVLAPDQRGYNLSEKPRGVAHYTLDALADDVAALIGAAGREKAILVGHDWGGLVAWWTAIRHAGRVDRLAVLNAPHPDFITRSKWTSPAQLLRSWYVAAFQLPWLPEMGLGRLRGKALAKSLKRTSRPGTFSDAELARYRDAWSQPGALTSMINWYRAALRARPSRTDSPRIRPPALIVWGARDAFLRRVYANEALARCDQGRLQFIEEATHWVHHEEPERVNRLLIDFLRPEPASAGSWFSEGAQTAE
jgi:pimeloyl-ACP methyl ester carboxylesterase